MQRRFGMASEGDGRLGTPAPTSPLERILAAADKARAVHGVARAGMVYARGIYAPNIKEPFFIANRRGDLVEVVRAFDRTYGARRAA